MCHNKILLIVMAVVSLLAMAVLLTCHVTVEHANAAASDRSQHVQGVMGSMIHFIFVEINSVFSFVFLMCHGCLFNFQICNGDNMLARKSMIIIDFELNLFQVMSKKKKR